MAVALAFQSNATTGVAISWSASATATATAAAIGTASSDRIVVVAVGIEADFSITACTIGGITAVVGPGLQNTAATPDQAIRFFYAPVPTGTTANIVVTLSGSTTTTGNLNVWAMTGATMPHFDSNTNSGSATSINLQNVTINTNGAGLWAWTNATDTTAVAWTNATERSDIDAGTFRFSCADTTTAGTPSVTADGANAQNTIVGLSFNEMPTFPGWDFAGETGAEVPHLRSFEVMGT